MSEADSPNDQQAPASINPLEQNAAVTSTDAEGPNTAPDERWQTVDFPGAMSVDALPQSQSNALGGSIAPGVIHYSGAEIDPSATYTAPILSATPNALTQLQQLQDENAVLRDRLTQVEQDLVQQQIEWQLESACSLPQTEPATDAVMPTSALGQLSTLQSTHDRLHQLLQELERSHQTAQRQQILVETLTEQLGSSQARIAQLERDCALTQQRYNEQVQQVLQAESVCRDLRLRLHRQQQQTLQFKAALEKCLEMPTIYGQVMPDGALDDSSADDTASPVALAALLKPKNQPVKPWSLPDQIVQAANNQRELPKPLFKLDQDMSEQGDATDLLQDGALLAEPSMSFGGDGHESATAPFADLSALLNSNDPQFVTHLMQLMLPDAAECQSYTAADALHDELQTDRSTTGAVFDLSPFLEERGNTEPLPPIEVSNQAPVSSNPSVNSLTALPESVGAHQQQQLDGVPSVDTGAIVNLPLSMPSEHANDPLWHDLEALIEPLPPVASTNAVAATEVDTDPAASVEPLQATTNTGIPPLFATPREAAPALETIVLHEPIDKPVPALTAWTWRDRLVGQNKAPQAPMTERAAGTPQSASKLLVLSAGSQPSSVKQQTISVSSHADLMPTPSPIVYPLRSAKKLVSLAAVDLPTFPRR